MVFFFCLINNKLYSLILFGLFFCLEEARHYSHFEKKNTDYGVWNVKQYFVHILMEEVAFFDNILVNTRL